MQVGELVGGVVLQGMPPRNIAGCQKVWGWGYEKTPDDSPDEKAVV